MGEMIEIYTRNKCQPCSTAKVAMQMQNITFTENPKRLEAKVGFPYFVNSENNKTYEGWPGSIEILKKELEING